MSRLMVLTANDQITLTIDLVRPKVMIRLLHIISQARRIVIILQPHAKYITAVRCSTKTEGINPRRHMSGINQGGGFHGHIPCYNFNDPILSLAVIYKGMLQYDSPQICKSPGKRI